MMEKEENMTAEACQQSLDLANTQQTLLNKHIEDLENLKNKVDDNPEGAIEACRTINPGLSRPECETRVNNYIMGEKKVEYDETQEMLEKVEMEIAELEMQCG